LRVRVGLRDRGDYEPQRANITFDTDHGRIITPAELYVLPRHHASPETVTLNVQGDSEPAAIEVVHRVVGCENWSEVEPRVVPEGAVSVTKLGTRSGRVAWAPQLTYTDVTYRFSIQDPKFGLHTAAIKWEEPSGQVLVEVPVVWNRVPYLSSTPERVILGKRAVRVFLRCPDESIELTQVLSAPHGVKAVVSSPREFTVRLDETAPGIIDSLIEVGTTAEGQPPLRIPVVRYYPPDGAGYSSYDATSIPGEM
jgi:hypothetical protein